MRWLTKKRFGLVFTTIAFLAIVQWYINFLTICESDFCTNIAGLMLYTSIALFFLLVPSLLTLPLKLRVFETWRSFALWAVPITLALSALIVIGGEGNAYISFGVGPFFLMILYGLYFLISLIIIAVSWWKTRKAH